MSFEATVQQWAAAARSAVLTDVKAITKMAHENIVSDTPIDTGRAKSSWNVVEGANPDLSVTPELEGFDNPISGAVIRQSAKGASPLTAGQAHTAAFAQHQNIEAAKTPVLTISNNLDYIIPLEKGSSKQTDNEAGMIFTVNVHKARTDAVDAGFAASFA